MKLQVRTVCAFLGAMMVSSTAGSPTGPAHFPRAAMATPLPPTSDPFYVPPASLAQLTPGAIIRTRSTGPLALFGLIPTYVRSSYQLMYRSTDSRGNPSAAITTIIVPNNANTSRVLSYQYAEDAAYLNCAPSYTVQQGANASSLGANVIENQFVVSSLSQGWVVNIPDYEGLTSAFTSGLQAGQATLDSVRAALNSGYLTGISKKADVQLWGYSGGALASEWAAELQPSYAPELHFKGIALGGLTPNITSVLATVNNGTYAGLIPAGILGLGSAYPELKTFTNQYLLPSKAAQFNQALTQCLGADILTYANQDLSTYFKDGLKTLEQPLPRSIIGKTGIMGMNNVPQAPLYIYKAIQDEVSPIKDTDALVAGYCQRGARIQYVRDQLGGHLTEEITGSGGAFTFLVDRFQDAPFSSHCSTIVVAS